MVVQLAPMTTIVAAIFAVQTVAAACLSALAATRPAPWQPSSHSDSALACPASPSPALLADLYGTTAYAGILALPVTISRATAPLAAAALIHAAGYEWLLITVAICCTVAAAGMLLRARSSPPLGAQHLCRRSW